MFAVVVVLIMSTLVHVHCEVHQSIVGGTAVLTAESACSCEHCPTGFATLPVEVDRAEEVGFGHRLRGEGLPKGF